MLNLTAAQARVLGSLVEKEMTTPDAYPLTLNALTAACNQTTNRDPVVHYEAHQVETTLLALKGAGLARLIHPGAGERATRYRHVLDEALGVEPEELAVLCVLLLRGAQTAPELRTRTERLHPFANPQDVERVLGRLAEREPPLVLRLAPGLGQREARWLQLLEAGAAERAAHISDAPVATGRGSSRLDELEGRVSAVEATLASLLERLGEVGEQVVDGLDPDRKP
jgi:uncharacterized protein YceH (UPF0502 family)